MYSKVRYSFKFCFSSFQVWQRLDSSNLALFMAPRCIIDHSAAPITRQVHHSTAPITRQSPTPHYCSSAAFSILRYMLPLSIIRQLHREALATCQSTALHTGRPTSKQPGVNGYRRFQLAGGGTACVPSGCSFPLLLSLLSLLFLLSLLLSSSRGVHCPSHWTRVTTSHITPLLYSRDGSRRNIRVSTFRGKLPFDWRSVCLSLMHRLIAARLAMHT